MDYVIFDLEWNQCPYGKGKENPKLPFEIIEIGAVKMDGERNVVGTFHRIVKPVVYQHLHHRTREVVGLTEEDLQNGIPFAQAVQEFFAFSGGACMFGTWGPGDLTELQRNMKFYNLLSLIRGPIHFYDVQKLFAIQYETMKSRRALEYAADFLHLPKDEHFHQALSDAKYTADIFARIDMDVVLAYDSITYIRTRNRKKRRSTPSIMATRNSSPANSTQKKKPCTTARSAARTAASAGKRQENAYAGFRPAGKTTTA